MKFYRDFLKKLSGKEKFRRALLKAPWLLDTVASRAAPVASLALSGCLVVFPDLLPAICAVPEGQKQLLTCQLQGQEGSKGQDDLGQTLETKHISFHEEEREAVEAHRVGALLKF
ncbi:uncharacterized protein LOC107049410 isoform X2 [Gallus gallus]|uniref:uncharacterized protein LOC107049410 isoform X2 n=1 Tax=Gallus gallus TaxID=9031 RepID=UPI001AEA73D7|nr:uncharacterized protein LOC107049410 isoform X2 [Gallus gallus]